MLRKTDAIELQEKLIILYKFITQNELYDSFFMECSANDYKNKVKNPTIKNILEMENNKEFLKECILELESKKPMNMDRDYDGENLDYILSQKTVEYLSKKYNLKDCFDVDSLDLDDLLELI